MDLRIVIKVIHGLLWGSYPLTILECTSFNPVCVLLVCIKWLLVISWLIVSRFFLKTSSIELTACLFLRISSAAPLFDIPHRHPKLFVSSLCAMTYWDEQQSNMTNLIPSSFIIKNYWMRHLILCANAFEHFMPMSWLSKIFLIFLVSATNVIKVLHYYFIYIYSI